MNGGVMIADYVAAIYAFGAIQTALVHRERNGVGSHVDVTLIESMMSLLAIQFQEAQSEKALASRVFAPMKTADGYVIVPLVSLKSYLSVYDAIGRSDWRGDPDYSSMAGLMRRRLEIEAAVADWAVVQTTTGCVAALTAAGVPCSAYAAPADLFDDPHLAERGVFAELNDAGGRFTVLNPPFRLSGVPCGSEAAVARAGEDTEQTVRRTLGLNEEEYRRFELSGAFG
jgi:CoA:oxalate CoA-transferase